MFARTSTIVWRQTLLRTNIMLHKEMTACRHIHVIARIKSPKNSSSLDFYKNCRVIGIPSLRYASTDKTVSSSSELPPSSSSSPPPPVSASQSSPYDEIPDPPAPLTEIITEPVVAVHPNGEVTFESIGLGGYSPVGLIESFMEFAHINYNLPWWGTIILGTVCVRLLLFPLVITSQKNMIKLSNHMPTIQELQTKMTEARQCGDHYESAKAATELMKFMQTNNISVMKNFLVPLVQAPIFISFFMALRTMANTPVESLKTGGFLWLNDLTIHDPYYIMPLITTVTMYITIELGTDGTNLKAMGLFRYVLRALPFIILPFTIHFPGAILLYWASTNTISLMQTGLLKIPHVRKALNMPTIVRRVEPVRSNKNFREEVREAWTNMKISKQLSDRERADAVQFSTAGKTPVMKTFKYDPTKQTKQPKTVLTKSR
ncbi:mitochondrial inner membrane protein OXA1L [Pseudomyrmex gracilis]|uniref:mitochondrial inner membrane protein OXA1L n=1 Tax=Pseudomyrmex gracilis TaxID=219809 RepID=UPI0009959C8D|nr:mitochondrial inner membrane protein OXA1L [Pseudomyrmex gracilis]